MELIVESIDQMKDQLGFVPSNSYSDAMMNLYYNNCIFLHDYTGMIWAGAKATMECVLYSEYYWGHCFIKRAKELMYTDAGFEQWHYKIIEKMEHSGMEIDYTLLERIDSSGIAPSVACMEYEEDFKMDWSAAMKLSDQAAKEAF